MPSNSRVAREKAKKLAEGMGHRLSSFIYYTDPKIGFLKEARCQKCGGQVFLDVLYEPWGDAVAFPCPEPNGPLPPLELETPEWISDGLD